MLNIQTASKRHDDEQWHQMIEYARNYAIKYFGNEWIYIGDGQQALSIRSFAHSFPSYYAGAGLNRVAQHYVEWLDNHLQESGLHQTDYKLFDVKLFHEWLNQNDLIRDSSYIVQLFSAGLFAVADYKKAILAQLIGLSVV